MKKEENNRPIVFGVAGGTGSGKTTVAKRILESVGAEQIAYFSHDAYYNHRPDLTYEQRTQINYDHPDSLETELLVKHITQVLSGEAAQMPIYNFATHLRMDETVRVAPSPIVLIDGILIFTYPNLRELMDVKLFVDVDADIRFIRRLKRDMEERGRELDSVIQQYHNTVRPMHQQFVEPSKQYADVILPVGGLNDVGMAMVVSRLKELLVE